MYENVVAYSKNMACHNAEHLSDADVVHIIATYHDYCISNVQALAESTRFITLGTSALNCEPIILREDDRSH